jgi:hypothetical protein
MNTAELDQMTGWTAKQRNHLRRCIKRGDLIAYWCSDAHGRPANHTLEPMMARDWTARPGLVQEVAGCGERGKEQVVACSQWGLHATLEPHHWKGSRVWVVALVGEVAHESAKFAALQREIIGEVFPECATDCSVGVRIGRKDLSGANLYGADLSRADLSGANLSQANLSRANLSRANLSRANLSGANLYGADLSRADLSGANLFGADLSGANLYGADLSRADLSRAYLSGANLSQANLSVANLSRANLSGAHRYTTDSHIPGYMLQNGALVCS